MTHNNLHATCMLEIAFRNHFLFILYTIYNCFTILYKNIVECAINTFPKDLPNVFYDDKILIFKKK